MKREKAYSEVWAQIVRTLEIPPSLINAQSQQNVNARGEPSRKNDQVSRLNSEQCHIFLSQRVTLRNHLLTDVIEVGHNYIE